MSDVVEAVKKVEGEFREALSRSDIEALGKLLTEDFLRTPPTTPSTTKTEWLELIRDDGRSINGSQTGQSVHRRL